MDAREKLIELAERCEKASEPDRETEARIAMELAWRKTTLGQAGRVWYDQDGNLEAVPPKYTASLDAALTLLPEGSEWRLERRFSKAMSPAYASVWNPGATDVDFHANAHGKSPALALCAAALRARAAMDEKQP
jgi:hypothetical protein